MKEPKHTPPPWGVVDYETTGPLLAGPRIFHTHGAAGFHSENKLENEADAHLIAAAPEMFEPLEEIARGPYRDSDYRSLCDAYAARARALLAKADGVDVEVA